MHFCRLRDSYHFLFSTDSANFQPKDYNQYQKRVRCSKWPESIIRNFRFSKELMKNASSANIECQTFCSQNEACWGCTVDCNDQSCQWNAIKKCRALERINQKTGRLCIKCFSNKSYIIFLELEDIDS